MILSGTGIIDSQRGPALPAEFVIGGNSGTQANRVLSTAVNDPQPWPTTTWTSSIGFTSIVYVLYDVIYNGTIWVGVGFRSTSPTTSIIYSLDGVNWSFASINTGSITLYKVRWNGVKFLATSLNSGTYWSSSDGINWIAELGLSSLMAGIYNIVFHAGFWYVGGYNTAATLGIIYRSSDGVSWSSVYSTNTGYIYSIGSNGSTLVAAVGSTPVMIYSTNGTTWSVGTISSGQGYFGNTIVPGPIVWCGSPLNKFVMGGFSGAVTSFKMVQSTNGITWTAVNTSSFMGSSGNISSYVTGLNWDGTYLWITTLGSTATFPAILLKSTDLTSFTPILNRNQNSAGTTLYSVGIKP